MRLIFVKEDNSIIFISESTVALLLSKKIVAGQKHHSTNVP